MPSEREWIVSVLVVLQPAPFQMLGRQLVLQAEETRQARQKIRKFLLRSVTQMEAHKDSMVPASPLDLQAQMTRTHGIVAPSIMRGCHRRRS
jgi:chloramphenicol 3-O-phosphotransferase